MPELKADTPSSQRRLQRPPDFTGERLNTFSSVVVRHGLPVALIAMVSLVAFLLDMTTIVPGMEHAQHNPMRYLTIGCVIFVLLFVYGSYLARKISILTIVWVVYLGLLSLWEEWVFRVVAPHFLQQAGTSFIVAVVVSNLVFGAMHYFTLRWKLPWCILAFVGGMALSRQFHQHEDFLWLVAVHWIATFINTPRMPGTNVRGSSDS